MFKDDMEIESTSLEVNALATTSFRSQQMIVQQEAINQQTAFRQTTSNQHYYSSYLVEEASVNREYSVHQLSAQKLPSLIDRESSLSWLTTPTPKSALNKLLILSRSKGNVNQISIRDLEYVIRCCDYGGLFPFAKRRKLAKIAVKILSYVAQNNKKLPSDAINALTNELQREDDKLLGHAILAIGYAINNGQNLPTELAYDLFEKIIHNFSTNNLHLNFPVFVIGLAALAKLGRKITSEELNILKKVLVYVENRDYPSLYPSTPTVPYFSQQDRRKWYRSELSELRSLKNIASTKSLLAKTELLYARHRWDGNSLKKKTKIIQIYRISVENGQRDLPERKETMRMIKESLYNDERKVSINGMATLGYLVNSQGDIRKKYSDYIPELNSVLSHYRQYAIQAINYYIQRPGNSLPSNDIGKWQEIFKQLQFDQSLEISNTARFILFHLDQNQESLEKLLLNKSTSINTTAIFLSVAEGKVNLTNKTLGSLAKILAGDYPMEAKYNAIAILSLVTANKQRLSKATLAILSKKCLTHSDITICNHTLAVFGNYAAMDADSLISPYILSELLSALQDSAKSLNASFALKNILANIVVLKHEQIFEKVVATTCNIMIGKVCEAKFKKNLALILLHAAKKQLRFNSSLIPLLMGAIKHSEDNIKEILLSTIGFIVASVETIRFSKDMIDILVENLSANDNIHKITGEILCDYSSKASQAVPVESLEKICANISDARMTVTIMRILKNCVDKKWQLPPLLFDSVAHLMRSEDLEVKFNVAYLFSKLANKLRIHPNSMAEFQLALKDFDNDIIILTIRGIRNAITADRKLQYQISPETCLLLSKFVNNHLNSNKLAMDSAQILKILSAYGRRLTSHMIHNLIFAYSNPNTELSKLILLTVRYQIKFIASEIKSDHAYSKFVMNLEEKLASQDDELLGSILLVMFEAVQHGHKLNSKTIFSLVEIMQWHEEESIRNDTYKLLNKSGWEETLSNPRSKTESRVINNIKSIIKAEEDSNILRHSSLPAIQHLEAAKRLANLAKTTQLPKNIFSALDVVLKNADSALYSVLASIVYLAIVNGQQIPAGILDQLVHLAKKFKLESKHDALAIALAVKKDEYISTQAVKFFEWLITNQNEIEIAYLLAIEVGVRCNMALEPETINRLFEHLINSSDEISLVCSRVINLIMQQTSNSTDITILVLTILPKMKHIRATRELSFALKHIFGQSLLHLSHELIENLTGVLIRFSDQDLRNNILEVLKYVNRYQQFSESTDELLAFKTQESILLDDKAELKLRIDAINNLKCNPGYITEELVNKFEQIIINEQSNLKDHVLSFLLMTQQHYHFPDTVMRAIGNLLKEDEAVSIKKQVALLTLHLNLTVYYHSINESDKSDENSYQVRAYWQDLTNGCTPQMAYQFAKLGRIIAEVQLKINDINCAINYFEDTINLEQISDNQREDQHKRLLSLGNKLVKLYFGRERKHQRFPDYQLALSDNISAANHSLLLLSLVDEDNSLKVLENFKKIFLRVSQILDTLNKMEFSDLSEIENMDILYYTMTELTEKIEKIFAVIGNDGANSKPQEELKSLLKEVESKVKDFDLRHKKEPVIKIV